MDKTRAGLVCVDTDGKWLGGRYYLQHLVGAVSGETASPVEGLCDVYWGDPPPEDPFAEVRDRLTRVVVRPPASPMGRVQRKLRRVLNRWDDARDLFLDAGIDVLFPIVPCERPGIPLVFWAPDFQQKLHPEWFSEELRQQFDDYQAKNVSVASRVVVSSEWALPQFQEFFPRERERGRVLRFCSVPTRAWWSSEPAEILRRRNLPRKFFVLSNQFSHHKNHEVVFEAVKRLKDKRQHVAIVCTGSTWGYRGPDYFERLMEYRSVHGLEDAIFVLGALPREEQIAVLRASCGVLQPSLFEGWSTTIEDARTLGKRIVASDIPVHVEQLRGTDARLTPPQDPEAWAATLLEVWDEAEPGPSPGDESEGLRSMWIRAAGVSRTFISILKEAAGDQVE